MPIPNSDRSSWFVRLAARRERLVWLNVGLLLLWFAATLLASQHLPDRVPMHFTPDGAPTRWEAATLGRWMFLPLLTLAMVAALPLLERVDRWLNDPGRRAAAPGAGPRATRSRLRRAYLDLCATLLILAMGSLHLGVWLVATGRVARIPPAVLVVSFGAFMVMLFLIIPLARAGAASSGREARRS